MTTQQSSYWLRNSSMKYLLLILFVISIACSDSNNPSDIPDCIQDILDEPESAEIIQRIRVQEVGGDLHYWLNTGFNAFDGPEFIVNNQCDTVCTFCGFCVLPDCADDYEFENWIDLEVL